ncbi:MAG TPA: CBS domain-containing protein [Candidatus Corynebacterium avicola]|uniref:CBS domain-containing protein n=1 Tax=Candidatus Corynebacterium avicola TaxID=2838527 RepID=A0A9D1RPL5_9CORY|nr:CBS domain-containing protein [Candidatus Corynebacterium avicola]
MSVELDEVRRFLAEQEPYSHLPEEELDALPSQMQIVYVRRGDTVITAGHPNDTLYIIRSGAVDVLDDKNVLLDRRETGRSFGYSTVLSTDQYTHHLGDGSHGGGDAGGAGGRRGGVAESSLYTMTAVEDSLLLTMPGDDVRALVARYPEIARYYGGLSARIRADADRLRRRSGADVLRTRLSDLLPGSDRALRSAVTTEPATTVAEAARLMVEKDVSCLPVVTRPAGRPRPGHGDGAELVGIITDRDMRSRVVAAGLSGDTPVAEVMTPDPVGADTDATVFEAMLRMSDIGIHHLPVLDEHGGVLTVLAATDIVRQLRSDPIYLTTDLAKATSSTQLSQIVRDTGQIASGFIERGASPDEVSDLLTVGLDSLARRVISLAEEEVGPPPVPYAFVVVGSQGRRAVNFASDQDNALILSDTYDDAEHGEYFAALSERICDGLHEAGQIHCPGDMMASNPKWRMTVSQWQATFHGWITAPQPEALLYAQIYFDMRLVHGSRELADSVHLSAVEAAQGSQRLHAQLAALAARSEPPLGIFRGLVVDRSGDYARTLHIKAGGTAALVQIARLYGIVAGSPLVGTRARIKAAVDAGVLSRAGARDLADAFEFLTSLTLRHQAVQLRRGKEPDYRIAPDTLGKLDRVNLRDAFGIVKAIQSSLAVNYPVRNT